MHNEWLDQLSDYIDDELTADERRLVDNHLAECADCAGACKELREIAERARALPPIPPSRDLWEGIEARLAPVASPRRRIVFTLPQLLAASLALALLSGFAALRLRPVNGGSPEGVQASQPALSGVERAAEAAPSSPAVNAALLDDAAYDRVVSDLERTLDKDRGLLDPATVAVVEENLAIIDRAVQEARQALSEDPANAYLNGHVLQTRQRKIDLLRQATALALDTN